MRELKLRKLFQRNSPHGFMLVRSAVANLSVPLVDDKQTELDPLELFDDPRATGRNVGSDPELFLQLSHERFLRRLVPVDVASGHIPHAGIVLALATPKTEKHAIVVAQYGADDSFKR
jgi:hypothetical protein